MSQIESRPGIAAEIEKDFGFKPDFENAKYQLEKADGAGNTFKATAKPVLIGTAVVGATTMVFGIIIMLKHLYPDTIAMLSFVHPEVIMGLLMGGAVIYWFTGASTQAVVTGAYRGVVYIKDNMKLDAKTASTAASKEVVKICTQYAQKGMINIFVVIFCFALSLALFNPFFFIAYLIAIAFFGLFQAIFMANAGGAWDNAKKIVEVELQAKGHARCMPRPSSATPWAIPSRTPPRFRSTRSSSSRPSSASSPSRSPSRWIPASSTCSARVIFVVGLVFVYRSFYGMRIPVDSEQKA